MIYIGHGISIDEAELQESFMRSSGSGGQNVQKVETAVQLRFDVAGSPNLPWAVKQRLIRRADRRMTKDGVLVISAQRFRTQERNRADARDRLVALIDEAATPPPPVRRPTRPTLGSRLRRLEGKRVRAGIKSLRGQPDLD